MPSPIAAVSLAPAILPSVQPGAARGGAAFQDLLSGAIRQVEDAGRDARTATERFLSGENEEVHQTVLAAQKAELAFEMFLQVRNKVVQAYQEVMRMQL